MDIAKLRVRIGPHEFEAEGPSDLVAQQFADWKALIQEAPKPAEPPSHQARDGAPGGSEQPPGVPLPDAEDAVHQMHLRKVFEDRRGSVVLRVPVEGPGEAALLTLYGFMEVHETDVVTTSRLMDCLELAGQRVPRIDRPVAAFVRDGLILQVGSGRGTSYRLTTLGVREARQRIEALAARLP